jgi:hypothetical protein
LAGDQRINSFGIGGLIEVRSGVLAETQVITGTQCALASARARRSTSRIVWPNGVVRPIRQSPTRPWSPAAAEGLVPVVFADAGNGLQFVTDFCGDRRSACGSTRRTRRRVAD